MPVQLLELESETAESEKVFNSLTPDQLAKLERAFWDDDCKRQAQKALMNAGVVGVGVGLLSAGGSFATAPAAGDASAAAAASIASGVTNAINMIKVIDGIGLAAFGVALAPMGFMVTLRVLNMVLSRV